MLTFPSRLRHVAFDAAAAAHLRQGARWLTGSGHESRPIRTGKATRIHVILIGGAHQFLHILPAAAWLSRQPDVEVVLFPCDAADARYAQDIMRGLNAARYDMVVLDQSRAAGVWRFAVGHWGSKVAQLLGAHRRLREADVVLVAERTSALLTLLPGRQPCYVRFTHGAGDRQKGFNKKAKAYDHFIVAGQKYARRFVAEGIAPPARISVGGYMKVPAVRQLKAGRSGRLFADERPVVLYNAHFDRALGSWSQAGEVIETILSDGRFNLIVAPHVRLFAAASREDKARWEAYGRHPRCIVDLGSCASTDMTYVDAADIYLGDVSSQVYEFLADPRPCVFLDSRCISWQEDENYRMWRLGQVVREPARELVPALASAGRRHARYRDLQRREVFEALGDLSDDPARRAGEIILALAPAPLRAGAQAACRTAR